METMIDFVCFRSTYPGCRIPRHRGEHRRGKDICHWGTSGCSAPSSRGFPRHCHRCPPPSSCPPPPARGPRCRTCCALWGAAGQQCLGLHCPDRYRLSGKLILRSQIIFETDDYLPWPYLAEDTLRCPGDNSLAWRGDLIQNKCALLERKAQLQMILTVK